MGTFIGDIFEYLKARGEDPKTGGPIVESVRQAIIAAHQARKPGKDEKLIIVAHSMGGNIAYDILTHFLTDVPIDLLVTVGSQVALFEELKLYVISNEDIPKPGQESTTRIPKPANVVRWINVFDPADVLGFAVEGVFAGAKDYTFSTGTTTFSAHGMYFFRAPFHERLRQLKEGMQ